MVFLESFIFLMYLYFRYYYKSLGKNSYMKSSFLKKPLKLFPVSLTNKINRSKYGNLSLILAFLIGITTLIVWFSQRINYEVDPFVLIAKGSALVGICLLSTTIFLSLRLHFMESIFGGMDKVYKAHHLIGQITMLVIFLHPLFLVLKSLDNINLILAYFIPGRYIPFTIGTISFLILLVLLVLTLLVNLPYKLWHLTHKFMGIALILATWHALIAGVDMNQYPVLRLWILIISLIGIFSYLYMLILYQFIGPRYKALVKEVNNKGNITEIKLMIKDKEFRFTPGQFVFLKFINLEKTFEIFPFSISCSNKDELLRISAKRSGDFTSNLLPKINVGDEVYLYGPYGKFGEKSFYEKKDMLWIAGGIGVTPFISMLNEEYQNKIDFIWLCSDKNDAIYNKEIKELISGKDNIDYKLWISGINGRMTSDKIINLFDLENNIQDRLIFICGPNQMMMEFANKFIKAGVPPRNIIFEDFNLI